MLETKFQLSCFVTCQNLYTHSISFLAKKRSLCLFSEHWKLLFTLKTLYPCLKQYYVKMLCYVMLKICFKQCWFQHRVYLRCHQTFLFIFKLFHFHKKLLMHGTKVIIYKMHLVFSKSFTYCICFLQQFSAWAIN